MKLVLILLIGLCYYPLETDAQNIQPIGYWGEHLPFNNAVQVSVDNRVYCATPLGFFHLNELGTSLE